MTSDGLTLYPIFPWVCPLLYPCAKMEQVCVCLVSATPCPAHIAKFLLCESHHHQSQNPYHGFHPSGTQTGGNLRVLDQGCWVDGVKLCNKLFDGFLSLQTCVEPCIVMMKQDFCWILVRLNSYEMLPEICQHPYLGIRLDCLLS
jgi:hypothetical protein